MKYTKITNKNITDNFLLNLLKERGILNEEMSDQDKKNFFYPTEKNELDPFLLDNIEDAARIYYNALKEHKNIRIYIDPDVDGFTSAALLYNYTIEILKPIFETINITYHVPEGKEHGLKTVMKELINEKICDLIIMPDSSSNDYEEHKILKELGYNIIVLDHHEAEVRLPSVKALVNPKRLDEENDYPYLKLYFLQGRYIGKN